MTTVKEILDLFDLTGKVAIVTGGAKGIGEGISTRLAQAGAKVVICDLNAETLDKTVNKLSNVGLDVTGFCGDVSAEIDCINTVKKAINIYGGIDILVNNAAFYPTRPLIETTQEEWDKVFAVNCRGSFLMVRETARVMIEQNQTMPNRGGSIIFISSLGAHRTNRVGMSAYHSSKGAINSLTSELSGEFAIHNIRVNSILPGAINTNKLDEKGDYEAFPMPINKIPLRRIGVPSDIANAVLYLSSPAAKFISGIELIVDGGMYKLPTFGYLDDKIPNA